MQFVKSDNTFCLSPILAKIVLKKVWSSHNEAFGQEFFRNDQLPRAIELLISWNLILKLRVWVGSVPPFREWRYGILCLSGLYLAGKDGDVTFFTSKKSFLPLFKESGHMLLCFYRKCLDNSKCEVELTLFFTLLACHWFSISQVYVTMTSPSLNLRDWKGFPQEVNNGHHDKYWIWLFMIWENFEEEIYW